MSQATRIALYPKTHDVFTHKKVFCIVIIVCALNMEISRFSDIDQTVNRLTASSKSLNLVTNVGRFNDKRPYLSSFLLEVRPFRKRPCHLNINARLHYNSILGNLLILKRVCCPTQRVVSLLLFRRRLLASFFFLKSAIHDAIFHATRKAF